MDESGDSVQKPHADVFRRWDAQDGPRRQVQGEENVVVVADDPPEIGLSQIAMGEQIDPVPLDHRVKPVVGARLVLGRKTRAQKIPVARCVENGCRVSGSPSDHPRTSE
ncbi:hypothetical protein PITCH_A230071 [uncultured Desulfobacterium sp.]|uniref:Uncharacterized protein n=1 Tax=uncultured Desulfobacterium sp. TaxID=201089 RepID=A0A445MXX9_9BACT|nr:hypothetical protein PITCH_A230071 [uncultured Desulfobacterium sp.]